MFVPLLLPGGEDSPLSLQGLPLLLGASCAVFANLFINGFWGPSKSPSWINGGLSDPLEADEDDEDAMSQRLGASSSIVGIFLTPLFLSCCSSSSTRDVLHTSKDGGPHAFFFALPSALAAAGIQGVFLQYGDVFLRELLLLETSWLLLQLSFGSLMGPLPSWVYLGASVMHLSLMYCWDNKGRKAISFSEASVLSQLATAAALCFFAAFKGQMGGPRMHAHGGEEFNGDVVVFLNGMFLLMLLLCLFSLGAITVPGGSPRSSYLNGVAAAFVLAVGGFLMLGGSPSIQESSRMGPILWLLSYVMLNEKHAKILLLLLATSAGGLLLAFLLASRGPNGKPLGPQGNRPDDGGDDRNIEGPLPSSAWLSSLRKLFHFLLLMNLLLVLSYGELSLLLLIMGGLLWLVVVIEALRISRASPLFSRWVEAAYAKFKDSRDANGLVLTHIYLVLGMAAPFLFIGCLSGAAGGAPSLLGIVLVGCGDSMAALVGAHFASPVLPFSKGKTVAGLLAFVICSCAFGFALFFLFPQVRNSRPFPGALPRYRSELQFEHTKQIFAYSYISLCRYTDAANGPASLPCCCCSSWPFRGERMRDVGTRLCRL